MSLAATAATQNEKYSEQANNPPYGFGATAIAMVTVAAATASLPGIVMHWQMHNDAPRRLVFWTVKYLDLFTLLAPLRY